MLLFGRHQPQAPIGITGEIGQHQNSDGARSQRAVSNRPPSALARIKPLGPIRRVEARAAHLRTGTALLEVRHKDAAIGCASAVGPAFIAAEVGGFVRRNQVGIRFQFLVALADGERESPEVLHLGSGSPPKGIPHMDGCGLFDVRPPDAFGAVDVSRQSAGKKAAVHRRSDESIVALRAALGAILVAAAGT